MTQSPGAQFERLLEIMRRLREPGGCPWDREQTRTSLKPFLIEETYEVLEAIESGDTAALQEELGDLLFRERRLARRARGVDEGRGRVARGRRCAGRRRSHAAAGRAGRRAVFARERRALASIDAEEALQGAIEKFRRRFTGMEDDLSAQGKNMGSVSQAELERSWDAVKAQERRR